METYDLSRLQAVDFERFLNQTFEIGFTGEVVEKGCLVQVTRLSYHTPLERQPFSIVFRTAPGGGVYRQGTYRLSHPDLGILEVFLVPVSSDRSGVCYEAVFS